MSISPRTLRPSSNFTPRSISGLALWLDASSSDLYTTDAGPVVAVASPLDIAGCVGWWDASDASTLFAADTGTTLATTTVGRWANKGTLGSAADLLQATSGSRPETGVNTRNGRNVLSFDGSADFLQRSFTLAQPCTVFLVFSYSSAYSATSTLIDGAGNGNTFRFATISNTSSIFVTGAGTPQFNLTNWGALNTWQQASFVGSGAASASLARRDGLTSIGGSGATATTTQPNGLTIASWGAFGLQYAHAQYAEVIAFDSALSAANIARVESYLAAKWSISGVHAPATASSDPVGYWGDKSGNGRHAVQATAGSRPTISATAQNGRKALAFDGSNGWMRTERTTYAARSVFTVFRRTGTAAMYSSPFSKQSNVAADYGGSSYAVAYGNEGGWSIVGSGTGRMNYGSNGSPHKLSAAYMRGAAMPLADAQNYLTGIVAAPNTTDAELLYAEAATDTDGNQAWFLGTEPFATTRKYPANILELLVYNRALTTAERQRVERYLASRWGITLAPQVANADAQNWIDRVYANGGSVSSATAGAVNTFCDAIDAASLRAAMYRTNLFCGGNLNAALVPLYLTPDKTVTNLFQFGTDMTNAAWLGGGNGPWTRTATTEVGPLGYGYATKLTTPSAPFDIRQMYQLIPAQNRQVTLSVWLKTNTGTRQVQWLVNGEYLDTFTVTSTWTRYTKTHTSTVSANDGRSGLVTVSELSDAAGFIYGWGMQAEYGATATSYNQPRYGNTTDTNVGGLFVSGDYSETVGLTPSGGVDANSTKYLNTGFSPSDIADTGTGHISAWKASGAAGPFATPAIMGADAAGGTHRLALVASTSRLDVSFAAGVSLQSTAAYTGNGLVFHTRRSSSDAELYFNGSSVAVDTTARAYSGNTTDFAIFNRLQSNNTVFNSVGFFHPLLCYSVGASMTTSQQEAFYNALRAMFISIGRTIT